MIIDMIPCEFFFWLFLGYLFFVICIRTLRYVCELILFTAEDMRSSRARKSLNVFTRFFIESVETTSPTIHPSVYISMVHHDNIYVFSFSIGYLCVGMYYLVYVRMYVYTWRFFIFSLFRMKTLTTLSFWRAKKIWIL